MTATTTSIATADVETGERYANGLTRPATMAQLPGWALDEFLARHAGPALEAARDEAAHRAEIQARAAAEYGRLARSV
jgi:hypothetical protein